MYDPHDSYFRGSVSSGSANADEASADFAVAVFSWGVIGLMALAWAAFAVWVARYIHLELMAIEQGLKPIGTGRGYAEFAWTLREAIGLWPTTLLFFAAMISPIPAIYFEIRKKMAPAPAEELASDAAGASSGLPRLSPGAARIAMAALAGTFFLAVGGLRLQVLPVGVAAFLLVTTPILALALRVHQGNSCE